MKTVWGAVGTLILAGGLLLAGTAAGAGDLPTADAIKKGQTAAEHMAIADQYAKAAADFRKQAAVHEAMLSSYKTKPRYKGKESQGPAMAEHCQKLIDQYTAAAAEAEALAAEHLALAGQAGEAGDEDQNAIAARYEKEAKELREKAAMHKTMMDAYERGPTYQKVRHKTSKGAMTSHCQKLIDEYTAAAKEAEALAKEHRAMAAK